MNNTPANMHEVVQRLRAEKSEALAELQEFYGAVLEVQRHLLTLVRATREFNRAMQQLVLPENNVVDTRLLVLREEIARIGEMAMLVLAAYGEICLGVQGWDIERGDHESN